MVKRKTRPRLPQLYSAFPLCPLSALVRFYFYFFGFSKVGVGVWPLRSLTMPIFMYRCVWNVDRSMLPGAQWHILLSTSHTSTVFVFCVGEFSSVIRALKMAELADFVLTGFSFLEFSSPTEATNAPTSSPQQFKTMWN